MNGTSLGFPALILSGNLKKTIDQKLPWPIRVLDWQQNALWEDGSLLWKCWTFQRTLVKVIYLLHIQIFWGNTENFHVCILYYCKRIELIFVLNFEQLLAIHKCYIQGSMYSSLNASTLTGILVDVLNSQDGDEDTSIFSPPSVNPFSLGGILCCKCATVSSILRWCMPSILYWEYLKLCKHWKLW